MNKKQKKWKEVEELEVLKKKSKILMVVKQIL